MARENCWEERK